MSATRQIFSNSENKVYFAPSPLISIRPSWNPPHFFPTTSTLEFFSAYVVPLPVCISSPVTPGKTGPPSTLYLGSIASLTGTILTLSPGLAIIKSASVIFSSSYTTLRASSLFICNIPCSNFVVSPKIMSLT